MRGQDVGGADTFSPAMAEATHYMRWIVAAYGANIRGRILEVGLGHGSYYPLLRDVGSSYVGVELDAQLVAFATQKFPEARFVQADVTSASDPAFLSAFDTVICFNVLEHINDDAAAVRGMLKLLAPRGRLCLFVPALPFLYSDLDRLAGHYRRYTLGSIRALLVGTPASILELRYFNPVGGLGWLMNRLFRHGSLADEGVNKQIELFDRYLVPISRALDPLSRRFFGQSILCVLSNR